jgi:hypothetical protein
MAKNSEPVVLELAALPREQMGPFLLLGIDKSASKESIEEHWAERLKWARRQLIRVPLEDINWARDVLNDPEKRLKYDAGCVNADTTDSVIANLARRFGLEGGGQASRMWQPLDDEKALANYAPPAEIPDQVAVRAAIVAPDIPPDVPAAVALLARLVDAAIDPWGLELPPA